MHRGRSSQWAERSGITVVGGRRRVSKQGIADGYRNLDCRGRGNRSVARDYRIKSNSTINITGMSNRLFLGWKSYIRVRIEDCEDSRTGGDREPGH